MSVERIVVAGAGTAGHHAAAALRKAGFTGELSLVGDEAHLPYHRPPLSKDYLLGTTGEELLPLRARKFYEDNDIALYLGEKVERIHREQRRVGLSSGRALGYDHLVLALGARPRRLGIRGCDIPGVAELRNRDDAAWLREELRPDRRLVVVGGGFIGLEVAAAACQRGVAVTVLEAMPNLMTRSLSRPTAEHIHELQTGHGVRIVCPVGISAIERANDDAISVVTSSGARFDTDAVVIGAGVVPNVELAQEAGITVDNGIQVDARLLTSDPSISAIGDCANFPNRSGRGRARIESIQNAVDQARYLSMRILGKNVGYDVVPYFWSNQFEVRLQIVGQATGHDHTVRRGDASKFSIFCYQQNELIAVESVNDPVTHLAARKIMSVKHSIPPAEAIDPNTDLRGLSRALSESSSGKVRD